MITPSPWENLDLVTPQYSSMTGFEQDDGFGNPIEIEYDDIFRAWFLSHLEDPGAEVIGFFDTYGFFHLFEEYDD